jgi:glycerate 2-kinase
MTGAGGGLAGALWAAHGAELRSGARHVLKALGFDERLDRAAAVVLGEGRLDGQSRYGKITGEILGRARARSIPTHAIVGSLGEEADRREWSELASIQLAGSPKELEGAGALLAAAGPASV